MLLTITYPFSPRQPSVHTSLVADLFGIIERQDHEHVVAHKFELPVEAGSLIAFTGPSGSGKSSLLRGIARQLRSDGESVVDVNDLPLPDVAIVDGLDRSFDETMGILSSCGLTEPRLMLRRPCELSDGERWRFRLARAIARSPRWIVIDEFTAALDRTLAKIIAFGVRRQCQRTGIGFLVATCHEDVIDDLRPDVHVRCDHDGEISLQRFSLSSTQPSPLTNPLPPCSASHTNSKSRPARHATGRISLGGIIARTGSGRCDS